MAREGVPPTRNCPRWLEPSQDGTGYDKIEDRVRVVQDIFAMAASGMGEMAIIKKLNAKGDLNFRKPPTPWQAGQIDHIVMSKAPMGIKVCQRGDKEFMHYPEIVDPTTWRAAQQARKANRYTKQNWAEAERTGALLPSVRNLFPSKIFCSHCHGKMAFNTSPARKNAPPRFRLYCNKGGCSAAKAGISYTILEKAILSRLEYADREGLLDTNPSEEMRMADLKISRIENAIATATEQLNFFYDCGGTSAETKAKIRSKDDELNALRVALREAKSDKPARTTHDHTKALAEVRAAAEAGDYESRQRVRLALNSLVDRISCEVNSGLAFVWVASAAYSFIVDTRGLDDATRGTCFDLSYVIERIGEDAVESVINDTARMRAIVAQFGRFLEEEAAKEEAPAQGRRLRIPAHWQYEEGDE